MRSASLEVVAASSAQRAPRSTSKDVGEVVHTRLHEIIAALDESHDFETARKELGELFEQLAFYAPLDEPEAFRQVACAHRLVSHLLAVDAACRSDLWRFLKTNDRLASIMAFLVDPRYQKPGAVYALLERLAVARGALLNDYANLAAAICVVHDRPFQQRVNENTVAAPDPLAIFDYFVHHEPRTNFGVREMPAELLLYVVDVAASIDEMIWASERYHGDAEIGRRFFDITYDYDHVYEGRVKRVTAAGYSLPNILQHGGVCADQAYFAMTIGKAIGVPTTYTYGRSSELSHAWVGFLQSDGQSVWWNFDFGRYEPYRGVRGEVLNPQTRRRIPDEEISLLAEFIRSPEVNRQRAAALTDAAQRLRLARLLGEGFPIPDPLNERSGSTIHPRKFSVETELEIIEAALRINPGYAPAWYAVRDRAKAGDLNLSQKRYWSSVLDRLCGDRFLDFQLAILIPMIETVDDVNAQNALWNAVFERFSARHDLAATIRLRQGALWNKHGDVRRAGQCYEDVVDRYINAGPFALTALERIEKILVDQQRPDLVLDLYARAWSMTERPKRKMAREFHRQSNWYRIGAILAERLQVAGHTDDAGAILGEISP